MAATGVLLLDQNEFFAHFRDMIVKVCGKLGFSVKLVNTADEIPALVDSGDYRLLIVDPEMADTDGLPFGKIEVVVIQDMDSPGVREEMRKTGAGDMLARYYSHEEIAFVLNSILHDDFVHRRKYPRILAGFPGGIECGGKHVEGTVVNISEGGAFLKSYESLKPGDEGRFFLQFEGDGVASERFECEGRVVYVKPYNTNADFMVPGMGIKFLNLSEDEAKNIRQFVENRIIKPQKS